MGTSYCEHAFRNDDNDSNSHPILCDFGDRRCAYQMARGGYESDACTRPETYPRDEWLPDKCTHPAKED